MHVILNHNLLPLRNEIISFLLAVKLRTTYTMLDHNDTLAPQLTQSWLFLFYFYHYQISLGIFSHYQISSGIFYHYQIS